MMTKTSQNAYVKLPVCFYAALPMLMQYMTFPALMMLIRTRGLTLQCWVICHLNCVRKDSKSGRGEGKPIGQVHMFA